MSEEYKKYDSQLTVIFHNARLTDNADVRQVGEGEIVSLSVVNTRRSDRYSEQWMDVQVSDFNAAAAKFLEKGDVLGIESEMGLRKWTDKDGNERSKVELIRAELKMSPALIATLKGRGFVPGQGGSKTQASGKKNPAKGNTKQPAKGSQRREVVDLPDDDAE